MNTKVLDWELSWASTAAERYESGREAKALDALADHGIEVTGGGGGVDLQSLEADNMITIRATITQARLAMRLVRDEVKRPVALVVAAESIVQSVNGQPDE